MRVVCDIECNGLINPTQIWVIVCKDIDTGIIYTFREVTENAQARNNFTNFSKSVTCWIGHNWLGYDYPILSKLLGINDPDIAIKSLDTFILSKLIDFPRIGHSLESYGIEFNIPKGKNTYVDFFGKYTKVLEDYCIRDVEITHKIYLKYLRYISNPLHTPSITLEHKFQMVVNDLETNGFSFDTKKAAGLLSKVRGELDVLDTEITTAFPDRLKPVREITPRLTSHGTLNKSDFRWVASGDLSEFNGGPFSRCQWVKFNPSSHQQIVNVLHDAGWSPTDKTETHKDTEKRINRLKYSKQPTSEVDISLKAEYDKILGLQKYGWKINETNLQTLPLTAPLAARTLAKRILLESRRRTLVEWLGLVDPGTERIHGSFSGIGAWTHRMAHQKPNTANIPNDLDIAGKVKLYGKEMRSCWRAAKNRLLVGVDAEGIQLRIFAHYIDDPEFTKALVEGKKEDKSDPHSLNQRILGRVCKSRAAAKRFIFALLLGAGIGKLQEILQCGKEQADAALGRLLERYEGFAYLKSTVCPADARRGWFTGIDGRRVRIPGDTASQRRHLCMSGYLQNGEAVVMKAATIKWYSQKEATDLLVDLVHDEWQTETENNLEKAIRLAQIQSDALSEVGQDLGLRCPLAGSYYNDDIKAYTIGQNWSVTH